MYASPYAHASGPLVPCKLAAVAGSVEKPGPWTEGQLKQILEKLADAEIPFNPSLIQKDADGRVAAIASSVRPGADGKAVYKAARRFHKTWPAALEFYGHKVPDRLGTWWNEDRVRRGFAVLVREKLPLEVTAFRELPPLEAERARKLLSDELGEDVTVHSLIYGAHAVFNDGWDGARAKFAPKPPQTDPVGIFWNKENLIDAIKLLHRNEVALTPRALQSNVRADVPDLLLAEIGRPATTYAVYDAGAKYFGSWDKALIAAGINPEKVRTKNYRRWTAKDIRDGIALLHARGVPLHHHALDVTHSEVAKEILRELFPHEPPSGRELLRAALRRQDDDWDKVLVAHGHEPKLVRKRGLFQTLGTIEGAIVALRKAGKSLYPPDMVEDVSEETIAIIHAATGVRMTARQLFTAAVARYQGWYRALAECGIRMADLRSNPASRYTPADVGVSLPVGMEGKQYVPHPEFLTDGESPEYLTHATAIMKDLGSRSKKFVNRDKSEFEMPETPSPDENSTLFRAMNFLRYRADRARLEGDRAAEAKFRKQADAIFDFLVRAHHRLVPFVARSFKSPFFSDEEVTDSIKMTLVRTINFFNINFGFRFSTYFKSAAIFNLLDEQTRAARAKKEIHLAPDKEDGSDVLERETTSREEDPSLTVVAGEMRERLTEALDKLDERPRAILKARYGIGGVTLSRKQLARHYKISEDKIGQIEREAQAKLAELLRQTYGN